MKNAGTKENTKGAKPGKSDTKEQVHSLQLQVEHYKNERDLLLALSNDITRVREKNDLIKIFSSRLKSYFEFTHAVISLIDEESNTYFPFLFDADVHPAKDHIVFNTILTKKNSLDDPFISQVIAAKEQMSIRLQDIINQPGLPLFIRPQYEKGIKHALVTLLRSKMKLIGFVYLSSSREEGFAEDLKNILRRIAPHLSNALANILINEEILAKDKDKSFLIEFSHDIASARTKEELSQAIHHSLKKLAQIRGYFIRVLNDDGLTLSPFMHDQDIHYKNDPEFKKLLAAKLIRTEGVTGKVLSGDVPVFIDFVEEINQGNTDHYIEFWKTLGPKKAAFQKMVGVPLRTGNKELGVLWVITDKINGTLLEGMSAQVSIAISNIKANEETAQREEEKSFLLGFSSDIATVRTKEELARAVGTALSKLNPLGGYVIRRINEDGTTMSPYIYDLSKEHDQTIINTLEKSRFPINDGIQNRILESPIPLLFNVDSEIRRGITSSYLQKWKEMGFKIIVGIGLRNGETNLGILFLDIEEIKIELLQGICAQISIALANIMANEQVLNYKQMLEIENDHLREQIKTIYNFSDIIGTAPSMQKVYHLMSLVAESSSTVLLLGETGTGKELIARAIHNSSPRKSKLMVKVNCAALPSNLIESELFGHEKGSFTGAIEQRIGKFELANGSTLFLDEIGEMPLETQVKLLRVLQERELERVGGKTTIKVDVRIIAATNRHLENEVKAGRFRSDLYYRLNVFPITLPPLKDRREDIAHLANFFLERYSKNSGKKVASISPQCIDQLNSYTWPGNVRELEHLMERSILMTEGNVLTDIQLPKSLYEDGNDKLDTSNKTLQQLERAYIIEVLKRCGGKISGKGGAADVLEIPSTTLHSKMKKLGISKADYFQ